jgi:hypothetical protein
MGFGARAARSGSASRPSSPAEARCDSTSKAHVVVAQDPPAAPGRRRRHARRHRAGRVVLAARPRGGSPGASSVRSSRSPWPARHAAGLPRAVRARGLGREVDREGCVVQPRTGLGACSRGGSGAVCAWCRDRPSARTGWIPAPAAAFTTAASGHWRWRSGASRWAVHDDRAGECRDRHRRAARPLRAGQAPAAGQDLPDRAGASRSDTQLATCAARPIAAGVRVR